MLTQYGAAGQTPNQNKFDELVVYIANRSTEDANFGVTKLNKILFYSDFFAYERLGMSITGFSYIRLPFGPCPRSGDLQLKYLVRDSRITISSIPRFNQVQKRIHALTEASLEGFSADEIAIVEEVLDALEDLNAREASNLSHTFIGWKLAEEHEAIPYAVSLIDANPELSEGQFAFASERADSIAKRLG